MDRPAGPIGVSSDVVAGADYLRDDAADAKPFLADLREHRHPWLDDRFSEDTAERLTAAGRPHLSSTRRYVPNSASEMNAIAAYPIARLSFRLSEWR